jgi:hypothetical protein
VSIQKWWMDAKKGNSMPSEPDLSDIAFYEIVMDKSQKWF